MNPRNYDQTDEGSVERRIEMVAAIVKLQGAVKRLFEAVEDLKSLVEDTAKKNTEEHQEVCDRLRILEDFKLKATLASQVLWFVIGCTITTLITGIINGWFK